MAFNPRSDSSAGDFCLRSGGAATAVERHQSPNQSALLEQVDQTMRELVTHPFPSAAQRAALYHLNAGGGRFRARLAIDSGLALKLPPAQIVSAASAVELVHNASLVHDDLQDRDRKRRNATAVWAAFGDSVAVCAGDLMLSAAYAALAATGPSAASLIELLHRRVTRLIRGQDADLAGAASLDLAGYESIAASKSGPLLALPLEFGLILAGHREACELAAECGRQFSLGYQMFDDLRDLADDQGKGALNAVLVLSALGEPESETSVRRLALDHFEMAARLTSRLPARCGRLLAAKARQLSGSLREESGR
jgi:geranylgeranyl pyrophosphate synthase